MAGDLFKKQDLGPQCRNEFVLRVQPDPSIYMKLTVKDPGMRLAIAQVAPSSCHLPPSPVCELGGKLQPPSTCTPSPSGMRIVTSLISGYELIAVDQMPHRGSWS